MTTYFDPTNRCTVFSCPHCNTVYHEYVDYDKQLTNTEVPFIRLADVLLYVNDRNEHTHRLYQYACPQCGIVQIDTSDL